MAARANLYFEAGDHEIPLRISSEEFNGLPADAKRVHFIQHL